MTPVTDNMGDVAGMVLGAAMNAGTFIASTAEAKARGAAINILIGFSYGLVSIVPSIIGICVAAYVGIGILAVGRNAERMIDEIRRQSRKIPGLLEGRTEPDYRQCVDIATRGPSAARVGGP